MIGSRPFEMIAICIDCCSASANKGKELKAITKSNQLSLHKRIHPNHLIRIIESGNLDLLIWIQIMLEVSV